MAGQPLLGRAIDVVFTGMEIIVGYADYPTESFTKNSHDFRPLGLGYANLGALLMHQGLPYDSEEGRSTAAAVSAIMCGEAYLQSARIAEAKGRSAKILEGDVLAGDGPDHVGPGDKEMG